jgi:hypothetical protein
MTNNFCQNFGIFFPPKIFLGKCSKFFCEYGCIVCNSKNKVKYAKSLIELLKSGFGESFFGHKKAQKDFFMLRINFIGVHLPCKLK